MGEADKAWVEDNDTINMRKRKKPATQRRRRRVVITGQGLELGLVSKVSRSKDRRKEIIKMKRNTLYVRSKSYGNLSRPTKGLEWTLVRLQALEQMLRLCLGVLLPVGS